MSRQSSLSELVVLCLGVPSVNILYTARMSRSTEAPGGPIHSITALFCTG